MKTLNIRVFILVIKNLYLIRECGVIRNPNPDMIITTFSNQSIKINISASRYYDYLGSANVETQLPKHDKVLMCEQVLSKVFPKWVTNIIVGYYAEFIYVLTVKHLYPILCENLKMNKHDNYKYRSYIYKCKNELFVGFGVDDTEHHDDMYRHSVHYDYCERAETSIDLDKILSKY